MRPNKVSAFGTLLLAVLPQLPKASDPCIFCTRGAITKPEKAINISGYEMIDSCATVDTLVPLVLTSDAPECQLLQSISTYCGCPRPEDSCTFCPDGSPPPNPDREIPFLKGEFQGVVPTCEIVEAFIANLSTGDVLCHTMQLISSYCGCPAIPNHCQFCGGAPLQEAFYDFPLLELLRDEYGTKNLAINPTCEAFYSAQYQITPGDALCRNAQFLTFNCGCNDGVMEYLGAKTVNQQAVLAWVPRVVAIVSLVASLLVLRDILQDKKKRASVYHQIVIFVAIFDCVTSLVWIVGTAAIPKIAWHGLPSGVYGAVGNEVTCTVQGFFFQLGLASVYTNVSLTVYYLLIIVYSVRENRLRRLRFWLIGVPVIIGLGMAFAVIPFVYQNLTVCDVEPYGSLSENLWQLVFSVVPVLTACLVIITLLVVIYLKVRKTRSTIKKWSSRASVLEDRSSSERGGRSTVKGKMLVGRPKLSRKATRDRLEHDVFVQCCMYAAVFGISWPLWTVGKIHGTRFDLPLGFWLLVVISTPLQGFNNALCYYRPFRQPRRKGSSRPSRSGQENSNSSLRKLSSGCAKFARKVFVRSPFRGPDVEETSAVAGTVVPNTRMHYQQTFITSLRSDPVFKLANFPEDDTFEWANEEKVEEEEALELAKVDTCQPDESTDKILDDVHTADDANHQPQDVVPNKTLTTELSQGIETDLVVPSESRKQSCVRRISSVSRRDNVLDESSQVDPVIALAEILQNVKSDEENGVTQTDDDQLDPHKQRRLSFLRRVGANLFRVERDVESSDLSQSVPNRQKQSFQRRRSDVVVLRRNQRDFDVPSSRPEIRSMPLRVHDSDESSISEELHS